MDIHGWLWFPTPNAATGASRAVHWATQRSAPHVVCLVFRVETSSWSEGAPQETMKSLENDPRWKWGKFKVRRIICRMNICDFFCLMCCFSVFVKLRKLLIRTSISWHCSHDICYYHPFFTNYSNYTYRHLLVITGYKLDYTYYKWGFCTYNCYFGHCSKTHHENKQRRKNTRFNYNKSASWLLTPGHWLSDVCSKAFHLREVFFLPIPKAWTCRHRLATNFRDEHFLMAIYQL